MKKVTFKLHKREETGTLGPVSSARSIQVVHRLPAGHLLPQGLVDPVILGISNIVVTEAGFSMVVL